MEWRRIRFLLRSPTAHLYEYLLLQETLTGFKWMANRGIELEKQGKKVLFAFEEAIGYMCGTAVWDKDGVSAMMQVANMVAYLDQQNITLNDQLCRIYDEYGFHTTYNSYYISHDPVETGKMFDRIRNYDGPKTVRFFALIL